MDKVELINKMNDAVVKMKEEIGKGVIKEHTINSIFNMKTGKETGQAVVMTCGTKFEYTEEVLNYWKKKLGADEFRIQVNRTRLFITFMVYYKEEDKEKTI